MQIREAMGHLTGLFVAAKLAHEGNPLTAQALGAAEVALQTLSAYTEVPLTGFKSDELAARTKVMLPLFGLSPQPRPDPLASATGPVAAPTPDGKPMAVAPVAPPSPSATPGPQDILRRSYAAQVAGGRRTVSAPEDVEKARADAQYIIENAPFVPEAGQEFATSVAATAASILATIDRTDRVSGKQATALENMRGGLEKWLFRRGEEMADEGECMRDD